MIEDIGYGLGGEAKVRKSTISFTPFPDLVDVDILTSDYFTLAWRFLSDEGKGYFSTVSGLGNLTTTASDLASQNEYPNVWLQNNKLAKAAYSTVLVDLGQDQPASLLLNATALEQFTSDFDAVWKNLANARPGPARHPYDRNSNDYGPLGTVPAVIETTYLCNVPRRRSTATLLWLIVVADLVALQALWTLFTLIIGKFYLDPLPGSQYCQGCLNNTMLLQPLANDADFEEDPHK